MKTIAKKIYSLICLMFICSCSGCIFLAIPAVVIGQTGHSIQEGNNEYDSIIVNFSYRYKQIYNDIRESNKIKIEKGQTPDSIPTFAQWLSQQGTNEKEQKAIKRYLRMKQGS